MKVWVFVEGPSDRLALQALWADWRERLRASRHGIEIIPLDDKSRFFRKIGPWAAHHLAGDAKDIVVGLPDLYPNSEYRQTENAHENLAELQQVQIKLVKKGLTETLKVPDRDAEEMLKRFYPSALKHDMEMLLLAAEDQLREALRTQERLGNWRKPVEDQNQLNPPKSIIEELFRTKRGSAYRDTKDAPAVLRRVNDLQAIFWSNGQLNCPIFKQMLDWVGASTGVPAYQKPQ